MTHKERVDGVLEALREATLEADWMERWGGLVSSAIREAENEALENAACHASMYPAIARAIRTLKSRRRSEGGEG